MKVCILTDNSKSWFIPFGEKLTASFQELGHDAVYVFDKTQIPEGDICFLLSCTKIIPPKILKRNKHNIVVHASDLPTGKGFSPLQWQILEDKNEIMLTLFEAEEGVDSGPFYFKSKIHLNGTELYNELRTILAEKIIEMCLYFVNNTEILKPILQSGQSTYYNKRTNADDEINPYKTIAEQFNHFRIADNQHYPLWFNYKGQKYFIKISKTANY